MRDLLIPTSNLESTLESEIARKTEMPKDFGEWLKWEAPDTRLETVRETEMPKDFGEWLKQAVSDTREDERPLTDAEKAKIKEETGWSDEIIDSIRNMAEYEKVYKNAELHEATIDGRECLVKSIDMDYVDPKTGLTNRELMARGRSPIDAKTGEKIELHHMGQDSDSPFAELCENSEHGDGNDAILHDNNVESWRRDPDLKNQYDNVQRPNHWKERAKEA